MELTLVNVALTSIPVLLGIIGYIIKRGLTQYDTKMDSHAEIMSLLKDSINGLRVEISKISILSDQRQAQCDERMSRVYGQLTNHDNMLDRHSDTLQKHELEITKLKKNEKV